MCLVEVLFRTNSRNSIWSSLFQSLLGLRFYSVTFRTPSALSKWHFLLLPCVEHQTVFFSGILFNHQFSYSFSYCQDWHKERVLGACLFLPFSCVFFFFLQCIHRLMILRTTLVSFVWSCRNSSSKTACVYVLNSQLSWSWPVNKHSRHKGETLMWCEIPLKMLWIPLVDKKPVLGLCRAE